MIGKHLFADECTAKQKYISYARILIEVNVTQVLPTEIEVPDPYGKKFTQGVIYEWKPQYCQSCMVIGHTMHLNNLIRLRNTIN